MNQIIADLDEQIENLSSRLIGKVASLEVRLQKNKKSGIAQCGVEIATIAGEIRALTLARALIIENS